MSIGHLVGTDGKGWYNFWSGLGADIGGLTILGGAMGVYRKHNCHVAGCWRIAKQQVIGTSWMVCHLHHPAGRPTQDDLDQAHAEHLQFRDAERKGLTRLEHLGHHDDDPESGGAPQP